MKIADEIICEMNLKPEDVYLGQGTLRPDLIESASKLASSNADAIKTHHNDTDLVRKLRDEGRVVEPLKDFHKDEVRELGKKLGLPSEFVNRHPFPGPGLAVRIICADEPYMSRDYSVAQMPVILIPIHFDRDIASRAPSCQRSVVLRTLITEDFMTGIPAIPNKHIPLDVS